MVTIHHKKKTFNCEERDYDKICDCIKQGMVNRAIKYACGSPPGWVLSYIRKELYPETEGMKSKELDNHRQFLYKEYLKNN